MKLLKARPVLSEEHAEQSPISFGEESAMASASGTFGI
jgi:hypothetical protein